MNKPDPIAILNDPEVLRCELRELQAREQALRVLLRAANARERARLKGAAKADRQKEGGTDAR
jgi:hypothetical protein